MQSQRIDLFPGPAGVPADTSTGRTDGEQRCIGQSDRGFFEAGRIGGCGLLPGAPGIVREHDIVGGLPLAVEIAAHAHAVPGIPEQ